MNDPTETLTAYYASDSWSVQPWDLPGTYPTPEAALCSAISDVRNAVAAGDYGDGATGEVSVWLVAAVGDDGEYTDFDVRPYRRTITV
jgi:hypothetical protein